MHSLDYWTTESIPIDLYHNWFVEIFLSSSQISEKYVYAEFTREDHEQIFQSRTN